MLHIVIHIQYIYPTDKIWMIMGVCIVEQKSCNNFHWGVCKKTPHKLVCVFPVCLWGRCIIEEASLVTDPIFYILMMKSALSIPVNKNTDTTRTPVVLCYNCVMIIVTKTIIAYLLYIYIYVTYRTLTSTVWISGFESPDFLKQSMVAQLILPSRLVRAH